MNGSLAERLLDASVTFAAAASTEAAPLPPVARAALEALVAGGTLPLKTVAEAAGIAKSTASGLVDGLCAQGLVRRERDAADARRLALRITPAGRRALADSAARSTARLDDALARLPEGDAAALAQLAEALVALLDGADPAPTPAPATPPAAAPTLAAETPAPAPAAPAPAGLPDGADLRLLVVQLDGGAYAVPVAAVREVVPYRAPRSLASPSPWLDGVVSVRGELLAVSDLRRTVGLQPGPAPEALVVAVGPSGPVALAVDRVRELRTVHAAALQPPVAGASPGIAGIAEVDGELLFVLDLAVLLAG